MPRARKTITKDEVPTEVTKAIKAAPDPALAQIWERRMVNPSGSTLPDIELKEQGFQLHWINTAQHGRFHVATRDKGWTPVKPDELTAPAKDLGLEDQGDGYVRRGIRSEEILMKIPDKVHKMIALRKAQLTLKTLKNTKTNLAAAAATRFGDEAAEFVQGKETVEGVGGLKGTIKGQVGESPI